MQAESLTDIFRRKAAAAKTVLLVNPVSRFLVKHAKWAGTGGYVAGNVALAVKNGLHLHTAAGGFNYDGAAGLMYTASALCLLLTDHKKFGGLAFRLNGLSGYAGIALLAYSGFHNNGANFHDWWKTLSPLVCFGLTATLTFAQQEIASLAQRAEKSRHALLRAFGKAAQYPVAYSAALDAVGVGGIFKSACNNNDPWMKGICAAWTLGVAGFAALDPRLKTLVEKENARVENSRALPAPGMA